MAKRITTAEILAVLIDLKDELGIRFRAIDTKLLEHDRRFDLIDRRFDAVDRRLGRIETRVEDLERKTA